MAHKLPTREYLIMLEIKYIIKSWQDLSYSDKRAIELIQLVIKHGPDSVDTLKGQEND